MLQEGAAVAAGLEPETPELVRYVLCCEVEAPAGRIATSHRVMGDDPDPSADVHLGDRGDGRLGGAGGLGRQRHGRGESKAREQDWAHGSLEEERGK